MSTKYNILQWMRRELEVDAENYIDSGGELNITLLAENCAIAMDHDEWLDDDLHPVWKVAADMTEVYLP